MKDTMSLVIPTTERLRYRCDKVDYDDLFSDIFHSNEILKELEDAKELPPEEQKAVAESKVEQIKNSLRFIATHVSPKEVDPNITATVYAETLQGEPVGRVIINHIGAEHPTIDIRVLPERQHQGFGYEMLKAIISKAFEQKLVDHLEYDVLTSNTASLNLVRKLGGQLVYADESGEMYVFYPQGTKPS